MIYADNAATTRLSNLAYKKMLPYLREQYGNPSSQYSLGTEAKRAIEHARRQVSAALGAEPNEIVFTSGGSEANSWVLRGVAEMCNDTSHFIVSSIEHPSIINICRSFEDIDIDVTYLPVSGSGAVDTDVLVNAIQPNTELVSIMLANNEIGTIQPVAEVGAMLREMGILFHTDAVQAVGHIPVDVNALQVDLLTASAHKFHGAKGTGFLYMRSGVEIKELIYGGGQEQGARGGTENVAGIVALGYALEESVIEMPKVSERLEALAESTVSMIRQKIPGMRVNGGGVPCLPGVINLGFDGISGEAMMNVLDMKGICVSTSSACHSGNNEPSHVLLALGLSPEQARSAIRISYGKYNTPLDAEKVAGAVCDAYAKITGAFSMRNGTAKG